MYIRIVFILLYFYYKSNQTLLNFLDHPILKLFKNLKNYLRIYLLLLIFMQTIDQKHNLYYIFTD